MIGRTWRRGVAALGALALLAACGSTLPDQATPTTGADGAPVTQPVAATSDSVGPATDLPAGEPGTGGPTPTGPVTQGTQVTAAPTIPQQPGPGVSADKIRIGVYTAKSASETFSTVGIKGAELGDMEAQARAAVAWVNSNGGAGGRKLEIVFHDYDITTPDPATEAQSACAAWTQDAKVFAVVSPIYQGASEVLFDCLGKRDVISIPSNFPLSPQYLSANPLIYQPGNMNLTKAMREQVKTLLAEGWFTPGKPVGVVRKDRPTDAAALRDGIRPLLEAAGFTVVDAAVPAENPGSALQNFVLRFKNAGVEQVLGTNTDVLAVAVTGTSQNYRPVIGLNSFLTPTVMALNLTADQAKGSKGIGWIPYIDVDAGQDPGPSSPRASLCKDILAKASEDVSKRATLFVGTQYCDAILFLKDGLDSAAAPNSIGFRAAVEALGTSMPSGLSFSTRFAPRSPHDGAVGYRLLSFDEACKCMRYSGPLKTAG